MEKPFSRKQLILELVRRGVSPSYAWRVTAELADHAEDIAETGLRTHARLGDLDALANQIVRAYRQRTFGGRHPLLTFVVAPLPLMLFVYLCYWVAGALVIGLTWKATNFASIASQMIHAGATFLPSMTLTALVCWYARRAGLSWKTILWACLPILVFTVMIDGSYKLSDAPPPGRGTFMIGLRGPVIHWLNATSGPDLRWPAAPRLARTVLPICVLLWAFVRERSRKKGLLQSIACAEDSATRNDIDNARQAA